MFVARLRSILRANLAKVSLGIKGGTAAAFHNYANLEPYNDKRVLSTRFAESDKGQLYEHQDGNRFGWSVFKCKAGCSENWSNTFDQGLRDLFYFLRWKNLDKVTAKLDNGEFWDHMDKTAFFK